jgi:hypothetical protein
LVNGLRISAIFAIISGTLLASFETLINWGQWQWWPWWLVDYVGAALLIGGGILALRRHYTGDRILCAGWAFNIGMAWMSMAGNIEAGTDPARSGRVAGLYVALIGLHIFVSTVGLLLASLPRRQS